MTAVRHLLCIAVGVAFVAAGVFKLGSLASPEMESTLVWRVTDGGSVVIAFLIAFEILLGGALCLRAAPRTAGVVALVVLAVFSAIIVFAAPLDTPLACGCAGAGVALESPSNLLVRNSVYALAVLFGTSWHRRTVREPEHASKLA